MAGILVFAAALFDDILESFFRNVVSDHSRMFWFTWALCLFNYSIKCPAKIRFKMPLLWKKIYVF